MDLSSLLTPWLALAAVLFPLAYAERWIHSHLYGVGWLLTNEPRSATVLYYMFLSPGVFLHEFVQWLVAGALNVETERVMAWPEAQEDGTLRLDFVSPKNAGRVKTAIIGAVPLIVGLAIIGYISTSILDLDAFLSALQTGDITVIGPAARELASTADFYLWLYLMFALANAMLPTPEERSGWMVVIGLFAVLMTFLVIIGVGDVLIETFTGPVAHGVSILTTAFGTILALEVGAILLIGFIEEVLERITKRKFDYSTEEPAKTVREPGSNLPLAPGEPFPSIYNLSLPIPDPAIQTELDAKKRRSSAPTASPRPLTPDSRPAREPGATPIPAPPGSGLQRAAAESPGGPLRREPLPSRGLRSAPGLAEERRAPSAPDRSEKRGEPPTRREQPSAGTPSAPPRREPLAAPPRTDRPTGSAPLPSSFDKPAASAFTSRPLPGKPAPLDRARTAPEAAPRPSPFPSSRAGDPARPVVPRRPLPPDEDDEPSGTPPTGPDMGDDVEYVDFDDL